MWLCITVVSALWRQKRKIADLWPDHISKAKEPKLGIDGINDGGRKQFWDLCSICRFLCANWWCLLCFLLCIQCCCFLCGRAAWHQVLTISVHCCYLLTLSAASFFCLVCFTLSSTWFGGRVAGALFLAYSIFKGQWDIPHNLSAHCFPFLKTRTKRQCWLGYDPFLLGDLHFSSL